MKSILSFGLQTAEIAAVQDAVPGIAGCYFGSSLTDRWGRTYTGIAHIVEIVDSGPAASAVDGDTPVRGSSASSLAEQDRSAFHNCGSQK